MKACRGDIRDVGLEVEYNDGYEVTDSIGELSFEDEKIEEIELVIPKMADFLQMHSSSYGGFNYFEPFSKL